MEEIFNLLLFAVMVLIWMARNVYRYYEGKKKKQEEEQRRERRRSYERHAGQAQAQTARETPAQRAPFSGVEREESKKRARKSGAKKAKKERDRRKRWKELTEKLGDLEEEASRLARRAAKNPYAPRLERWVRRFVSDKARSTREDLGDPGDLSRKRMSQAEGRVKKLRRRLDVLRSLAEQRSPDRERAERLAVADQVLGELLEPLLPRRLSNGVKLRDVVAAFPASDEETRQALASMGILLLDTPMGWTGAVDRWADGFHAAAHDLVVQRPGLLNEAFRKTGLSSTWAVPYSEPVYVSSNEILGPFGAWLPVLVTDAVMLQLLGPYWAHAYVRNLTKTTIRENARKTPASGSGWHLGDHPAPCLRVEVLARTVESLGHEKIARKMRSEWRDKLGKCESLMMPTRRGSVYAVSAEPYSEAGHGLMAFLLDQTWSSFGDRRFDEVEGMEGAEVAPDELETQVADAVAGRPVFASVRQRIASGLGAWLLERDLNQRISRAVLAGLSPRKQGGGRKRAGRVALSEDLELSRKTVVEALILGSILNTDRRASAGKGRGPKKRPLPAEQVVRR